MKDMHANHMIVTLVEETGDDALHPLIEQMDLVDMAQHKRAYKIVKALLARRDSRVAAEAAQRFMERIENDKELRRSGLIDHTHATHALQALAQNFPDVQERLFEIIRYDLQERGDTFDKIGSNVSFTLEILLKTSLKISQQWLESVKSQGCLLPVMRSDRACRPLQTLLHKHAQHLAVEVARLYLEMRVLEGLVCDRRGLVDMIKKEADHTEQPFGYKKILSMLQPALKANH
jgi:hypothetical protein